MKKEIKLEALQIAGGLYRMNAITAMWYGFCHNGDSLVTGEFIYLSEGEPTVDRFDGYIDLKTMEIFEL